MAFSTHPSAPSPLLSIPSEIRLMIYRLLMVKKSSGNIVSINKEICASPEGGLQLKDAPTQWPQLSGQLLRVCRVISEEAIVVLYSENVFKTTTPSVLSESFLPAIGLQNLALLKSVRVDIGTDIIEDLTPSSWFFQQGYMACFAVLEVPVLFDEHVGLRSIQDFSVSLSTPTLMIRRHHWCLESTRRRCLRGTHALHEQAETIGDSLTVTTTTIKFVKLSPELRGRSDADVCPYGSDHMEVFGLVL
jgi:hypothetical protein